jgi:hypothetical protein
MELGLLIYFLKNVLNNFFTLFCDVAQVVIIHKYNN